MLVSGLHQHESAIGIHVYPPSWTFLPPSPPPPPPTPTNPIPLLQVVTEHWVELPVTYGKFPLALCFTFGDVYISMLLSVCLTLPFPCCTHKSVFYVCISANSLISIIFLDSIYMCKYTIFFFLIFTYFTLYNRLHVHPSHWNWLKFLLFHDWLIFHCINVP